MNGTIKAPSPDDPTYAKWEIDNSLVMSWLTHSMEPKIAEVFISMERPKTFGTPLHRPTLAR